MGNGIAQVMATFGYEVTLCDISADALEKAIKTISGSLDRMIKKEIISETDKSTILARLSTNTDLPSALKNADLAIEAATENEAVKINIFKTMDQHLSLIHISEPTRPY